MHALRVNAVRVQTSLMIKMVSSLDAFSATYLWLRSSWNSWVVAKTASAFGNAIFEAPDQDAARKFMEEDPARRGRIDDGGVAPVCGRASTLEFAERVLVDGHAIGAESESS